MTRYAVHPLEAKYQEWEQERKSRRTQYWAMLKRAWNDYKAGYGDEYYEANLSGFRYWMERTWGVQIEVVDGNFGAEYAVSDEQKFLLFRIKYS